MRVSRNQLTWSVISMASSFKQNRAEEENKQRSRKSKKEKEESKKMAPCGEVKKKKAPR